jgi:hypothetical protein
MELNAEQAWQLRQQAEDLRDRTVAQLLAARLRCGDRLASLSLELAELREQGETHRSGPSGDAADALLQRTLGFAARLREIVDDAHRDMMSISISIVDPPPVDVLPDLSGNDTDDPNLAWLSAVSQHVPRGIVASLLQAVDIAIVNSVALQRPELLGALLGTLSPLGAAQWLPMWEKPAAVRVLSTMSPNGAARCLEQMDAAAAVALLAAMGADDGANLLAALPQETASRRLSEMDRNVAVRLLQRWDPEDTVEHLLQIEELALARHGEFVALMQPPFADRCLLLMDQKRSERKEALDLIRQVEVQRDRSRRK